LRGKWKFRSNADVDEIAAEGHMVRRHGQDVGDNCVQHIHAVDGKALVMPVPVSGQPLADQVAPARGGQRADMGIGQMGEIEGQGRSGMRRLADSTGVSCLGAKRQAPNCAWPRECSVTGRQVERPERRWLTWIAHLIFRFTRPMTLGVRARGS
jgi:hypothetical protein